MNKSFNGSNKIISQRQLSSRYSNNNKKKVTMMTPKQKCKDNSIIGPVNRKHFLDSTLPKINRSGTNLNLYAKKEQEKSFYSINSKFKNNDSLKVLEKTIINKIMDISMRIEKEDNFLTGVNNKENNNLNLSALILNHIEGDTDNSILSKSILSNNKFKLKKESKLDLSKSSINSKHSFISKNEKPIIKVPLKGPEKYRVLLKKNMMYDSFNSDEEREEEEDNFYISPKSNFVLIFDFLIIIFCLFDIVYTPQRLSKVNGFCTLPNKTIMYIYFFIDILYIVDLLLGFVRSYYNFQYVVIKYQPRIARHYIVTQFWLDFIQAIPVFTYISYLCKKQNIYCGAYDLNNKEMILLLFCFVKQVKLFKIIEKKKNSIIFAIKEIISEREVIESIFHHLIIVIICISCFYSFISIHIFIGRHSYPNWITKAGFQNQSHTMLYLTSFYYLMTTMTTVGYGDIVGVSLSEIIFQIIVLSVGITIYSWVVSNIGNYVKNESYASMQFNKDETILEEIRISHPNLSFKLYKQIYQHLHARKIRQQQCDSNLLINSLPYSLKNNVLFTMYKQTINNLKIFKKCQNSDFILRLLTNFIPLFSKKNAILIHEGQIINNIIFVRNGRLSLQAAIDKEEPEESIKHYLNKNFGDMDDEIVNVSNYESSISNSSLSNMQKDRVSNINFVKSALDTVINKNPKDSFASEINESDIGKEMGKWDYGGDDFEDDKYHILNIISISKNESYGVVYMFLDKPSPLSLRVKSKKAELLLLRKSDASDISQRYPNIWMKYFKKSYFNMFSIKNITLKKIKIFWDNFEKRLILTKKSFHKCKTNLNMCTIYKLNKAEINEITRVVNEKTRINRIKRAKTQAKKNTNINENIKKIFNYSSKNTTSLVNKSDLNTNLLSISKPKEEQKSHISNNRSRFAGGSNTTENNLKSLSKASKKQVPNSERKIKNIDKTKKRRSYINKLKLQIQKLKNSNRYYKNLCNKIDNSKESEKVLNKKFNKTIISELDKENNFTFKLGEKGSKKSINIYHNLNQNIINNITINNNTNSHFISTAKQSSNSIESEYESTISDSPRKFDIDEIKIKSEIKLFYKAKYTNLDKFTSGEYSKNEELQKQSLNYIKIFIETEKKKKMKKEISIKSIREKRKSAYVRDSNLRMILNKFNMNYNKKKENNRNLVNNKIETNTSNFMNKFKNNVSKKRKSNHSKKNSNHIIKKNYDLSLSPTQNEENGDKTPFSSVNIKKRKGSFFFKIPQRMKLKLSNEFENEMVIKTSDQNISNINYSLYNNENKTDNSFISSNKSINS